MGADYLHGEKPFQDWQQRRKVRGLLANYG